MMKEGLSWFIIALTAGYCCAINITDLPETKTHCVSNDDCATNSVCAKHQCVDLCKGVCEPHMVCNVTNHVAICSCSPGYSWHPGLGCTASRNVPGCSGHDQCPLSKVCIEGKCSDPCEVLCGNNTTCTVRYHIPACSCKKGHTGNPLLGCTPQDVPECGSNDDCATDKVCAEHHCVDPCKGVCGPRTKCNVTHHVAMCSCSPGYLWYPVLGCTASPQGTWPPPGKKMFYAVTSHEVDWQAAFMYCVRFNSRLASIDSVEEYERIKKLTDLSVGNKRFWTSGSDSASEGQFIWSSTGKNVSLPRYLWYEGEPNNTGGNENCIDLLKEQKFNYANCDSRHNFLCEYYV